MIFHLCIFMRSDLVKKSDIKKTKLDILNQTRDRDPMPRPTVFRDKKKNDRNILKDEDRKGKSRNE